MEIHKPKPIHSWREFLSEVGVVVIGIVIALSGEQLVEAAHHAEQRQELRQALDHDSRQAIEDSKSTIALFDRLIAWDITQIAQVRAAQAAHRPLGAQGLIASPAFDPPTDTAFQAAITSGRLSLLNPDEIAAYSEAHAETETSTREIERMQQARKSLMLFQFKFQQPGGAVDLSKAEPAQIDHYFDLLATDLEAKSDYEAKLQFVWGVREGLLRGDRDLTALYRDERRHLTSPAGGL